LFGATSLYAVAAPLQAESLKSDKRICPRSSEIQIIKVANSRLRRDGGRDCRPTRFFCRPFLPFPQSSIILGTPPCRRGKSLPVIIGPFKKNTIGRVFVFFPVEFKRCYLAIFFSQRLGCKSFGVNHVASFLRLRGNWKLPFYQALEKCPAFDLDFKKPLTCKSY